jgi:hypothetical protein
MRTTRPDLAFPALAYAVLGAALLVALAAWEGRAYLEYSDGVYAYTADAIRGAPRLYRDVAAAQPPGIFWLGASVLSLHDSVEALRAAVAGLALVQGGLVALAVSRLTRSAAAAVLAGLASLLAPWSLHEHGALIPETVGAPVLLGAALLAARPRWAPAAGALGALALLVKVSFLAPVAAVGAVAARRAGYLAGALVAGAAGAGLFLALYGTVGWDNVVTAQFQTGGAPADYALRLWSQAAWNLLPLLAVGLAAWGLRDRVADRALLLTLTALTLGAAALAAGVAKSGTFLQFLVVVEAPAVALAATTVTCGLRALREGSRRPAAACSQRGASLRPAAVAAGMATAGALGLTAAQSASMLLSPTSPGLLERPVSRIDLGWLQDDGQVAASVRAARACPPGTSYSGSPYLAFVAGRRMPGGQPDQFITSAAEVHAGLRRAAQADKARCP